MKCHHWHQQLHEGRAGFSDFLCLVCRVSASGPDTGNREFISSGHRGRVQVTAEQPYLTASPSNPRQGTLRWTSASSRSDVERRECRTDSRCLLPHTIFAFFFLFWRMLLKSRNVTSITTKVWCFITERKKLSSATNNNFSIIIQIKGSSQAATWSIWQFYKKRINSITSNDISQSGQLGVIMDTKQYVLAYGLQLVNELVCHQSQMLPKYFIMFILFSVLLLLRLTAQCHSESLTPTSCWSQ